MAIDGETSSTSDILAYTGAAEPDVELGVVDATTVFETATMGILTKFMKVVETFAV
jgi:hypothetical protein